MRGEDVGPTKVLLMESLGIVGGILKWSGDSFCRAFRFWRIGSGNGIV